MGMTVLHYVNITYKPHEYYKQSVNSLHSSYGMDKKRHSGGE